MTTPQPPSRVHLPAVKGLGWAVLASLVVAGCSLPLWSQTGVAPPTPVRQFGEPRLLANLNSTDVRESSGLAASGRRDGVWFTHNDSGDSARIFRFRESGEVDQPIVIEGATAIDWEDMEAATVDGTAALYVGDIGDNARRRPNVVVYRFVEPTEGQTRVDTIERYEIRYANGARDAEALLVDPASGDIYIVSKEPRNEPAQVLRVRNPRGSGSYTAEAVGTVTIPAGPGGSTLVTGGSVSADGRYVVLRTYLGAYEYRVRGRFDRWWQSTPTTVPIALEMQGEAIAYDRGGRRIVTTSEGTPCPVSATPIR